MIPESHGTYLLSIGELIRTAAFFHDIIDVNA
jgi:hypothetical protein